MVLIHLKRNDGDSFLYETTTSTSNHELIHSIVRIHNKRLQARLITDSVRGLAMYGVMKKPDHVSSSTASEDSSSSSSSSSSDAVYSTWIQASDQHQGVYKEDPTGVRIGYAPNPNVVEAIQRAAQDLDEYVDKNQVLKKNAMNESIIDDKISIVKGAVTMAYPMGLPDWDVLRLAFGSFDDLKSTYVGVEIMNPDDATLWAAGKEFLRDQLVSDRLGTNEKSKIIAKLQHSGDGAPCREPAVSEEERKAMMAYYFKKQEEMKRLAEADDDDYLNSAWADPKNLKRNLQGIHDIRAPGVSR